MGLASLTREELEALYSVSASLNVRADLLAGLISLESNWNPNASNPRSSARGLLQWIDATARELGYSSSRELVQRNPTIEGQLRGPVLAYLRARAPFPTAQSLAMAVFYPAARNWPSSSPFPPNVAAANPGIRTVADYLSLLLRHVATAAGQLAIRLSSSYAAPPPLLVLPWAGLAIGAFLLWRLFR